MLCVIITLSFVVLSFFLAWSFCKRWRDIYIYIFHMANSDDLFNFYLLLITFLLSSQTIISPLNSRMDEIVSSEAYKSDTEDNPVHTIALLQAISAITAIAKGATRLSIPIMTAYAHIKSGRLFI